MAAARLDNNERAFLLALQEVDPKGEYWTAHWAPGLKLEDHGADLIASTYNGSYQVMKRLASRKLVDKEGRMSNMTGVCLNDKGRAALETEVPV